MRPTASSQAARPPGCHVAQARLALFSSILADKTSLSFRPLAEPASASCQAPWMPVNSWQSRSLPMPLMTSRSLALLRYFCVQSTEPPSTSSNR